MSSKKLADHSRIVVKIGSSLLVDSDSGLKRDWLYSLAFDLAQLRIAGCEVCVVSSGSIALGRIVLNECVGAGTLKLNEAQAAAAVGQIELAKAYASVLAEHNQLASQVLLTIDDTKNRLRYLNARSTIETLLEWNAIPVINENDTVATAEIRYGDNDRLAARVASMIGADLLVLFSDVDGLYESWPPATGAIPIAEVDSITPEIESMAGDAASVLSRGGMKTKIAAAKIATTAGAAMVVTSGQHRHPLQRLGDGCPATWFSPNPAPVNERKKWIAGQLNVNGTITVDDGACRALQNGKSLLPAGVTAVSGVFVRGDTVAVVDANGIEVARGLAAFDSNDAVCIVGKQSSGIIELLGAGYRTEMIHRDDMVVVDSSKNSGTTNDE